VLAGNVSHEIDWWILGLGKHFRVGGHLWFAYRRARIECEYLDHAKTPSRRDLLAKRIFQREQLYSDFITESARAMADAIQHNFQDPSMLLPTYALLSRMRLSSSTDVLASAERVIQHIITTYSEPNLTPEEIQSNAGRRQDPLHQFSKICRAELEVMEKQRR